MAYGKTQSGNSKQSLMPGPHKHGQTPVKPSQNLGGPTQRKVVPVMNGPKGKC